MNAPLHIPAAAPVEDAAATMAASHAPGRFEKDTHLFVLRVYFEDTDLSGVAYHANYLRWCERARSDMLRLAGIDQRGGVEAGEGAYAITEAGLRYFAPARLDDTLVIRSQVVAVRAAACRIAQRVMRDDTLLMTADITAAFVSPTGRARRQPRDWITRFERLMTPRADATPVPGPKP